MISPTTLLTFGDSILDCGRYNEFGIRPAALLRSNDDRLFPEFRSRELTVPGTTVVLDERAVDGSTVAALAGQIRRGAVHDGAVTLLTIGGNDLRLTLTRAGVEGLREFERTLRTALAALARTRLFVGNVYDPTFGRDGGSETYWRLLEDVGVGAEVARRALGAVNTILAAETARVGGTLVDLHAHFLGGDESWFTAVIEPSLTGASEVRRAFLAAWEGSGR